jgi:HD-GYP domain-containing protein (c-di-GMP phosphodiesterase class II)
MSSDAAAHRETSLARILATFAFAGDVATGLELDDGVRACYLADRLGEELGLSAEDRQAAYYAALLKDLGCTCWTTPEAELWQTDEIAARRELLFLGGGSTMSGYMRWVSRYIANDGPLPSRLRRVATVLRRNPSMLSEAYENSSEVCVRMTQRLALPDSVQVAMAAITEQWNGKGFPRHLKGTQIPIASRVVFPTYLLVPIGRVGGREAAIEYATKQRGKAFDPDVVDAYLRLMGDPAFWEEYEGGNILEIVLGREPPSDGLDDFEHTLESTALALADFIDLKSPYTAAHSRRVAGITAEIARLAGCEADEVERYRIAALLHDLGTVSVPSFVLNGGKPGASGVVEESARLHPYYSERILDRIGAMSPYVPLVGNHHEHMDGSGYFRGLQGDSIPLGARIICVANRLDELMHEAPDRPAMQPREALHALNAESGGRYDPAILQVLRGSFEDVAAPAPPRQSWPAGLTDREVEVLQIAAKGLTRKQIGETLSISESTVRHHLEHIYDKTGTSTRVGATLFAMENDLLQ